MQESQNKLFNQAKQYTPGGVHSPVRSFKGLHTTPRFIKKSDGAYLYDTDDKSYIDFCMSFGPLVLGHRNRIVEEKMKQALENGWSYGACEPYSIELSKFLIEQLPFIDQVRFVNSGTEAVMTALRLARGATNKNKIIKFNGCYHGHVDSMLIKAGSGLAGSSESSSAGVSSNVAQETLILELGDVDSVSKCFIDHPDQIAAIIIEPLPANNGLLPQDQSFLEFLREITKKNNSLLIFDEVISGFRIGMQGMTGETQITPDIITYGKVIGGGLPVGAIAGKKEIMELLAPLGPVYQAGTLSANPISMIAGLETLKQLNSNSYVFLNQQTNKIVNIFKKWFIEYNNGEFKNYKIISKESLFWITPDDKVNSLVNFPDDLTECFYPLFETLLSKGIYLSPNAYEIGFCSMAHDDAVISELEKRLWS
ncbi:MAG: glutamate-1-semialdehyde 2,1-aminomutase [Bdellovibrionales bacterium]|nr:glutamate-1-semialdehyde 2,1-aminomutase [Bdellovibrionales bacterium]